MKTMKKAQNQIHFYLDAESIDLFKMKTLHGACVNGAEFLYQNWLSQPKVQDKAQNDNNQKYSFQYGFKGTLFCM